jgi:hypothetical protein
MTSHPKIVRAALIANACFSLITGTLALLFQDSIQSLVGVPPGPWLPIVGGTLILFAGHLAWSLRRGPRKADVLYFVLSDFGWVLGSLLLTLQFPEVLSTDGRVLVLALAIPVAVLGALQALGLGRPQAPAGSIA